MFIPVEGQPDLELPADGTPVDVPAAAHDMALRLIKVGRVEQVHRGDVDADDVSEAGASGAEEE